MNLILLTNDDMTDAQSAQVTGRRAKHICEVHRAVEGQILRVGLLGGNRGTGRVAVIAKDRVTFTEIHLDEPPPPPTGLDFILAIPRPKVLTRVLEAAASLGVKRLVLMNCVRVEKSYFDSPRLDSESIREALIRGLEQGADTVLPEVILAPRFRPFVEDRLSTLFPNHLRLLAHPGSQPTIHQALWKHALRRASDQTTAGQNFNRTAFKNPFEAPLQAQQFSNEPPSPPQLSPTAKDSILNSQTLCSQDKNNNDFNNLKINSLNPDPPFQSVIAIGPEGGFVPFEIQTLQAQLFSPFHLGERILRVETALPFIAGQYAAAVNALTPTSDTPFSFPSARSSFSGQTSQDVAL